jgi:hypothetical protein
MKITNYVKKEHNIRKHKMRIIIVWYLWKHHVYFVLLAFDR